MFAKNSSLIKEEKEGGGLIRKCSQYFHKNSVLKSIRSVSVPGMHHIAGLAAALRGNQWENPLTQKRSGGIDVRDETTEGRTGAPKKEMLLNKNNNMHLSHHLPWTHRQTSSRIH